MAGWQDLPNELTSYILKIFASGVPLHHRELEELVNVLLVCRRFRAIMEPIIYATPNVRSDSFDGSYETGIHLDIGCFLRTIILRPDLGRLVKAVSIGLRDVDVYSCTYEEVTKRCSNQLDIEESEAIIQSLPSAERDDTRLLAHAATEAGLSNALVLQGGYPGLVILLLHHVPSLKFLSISGGHEMRIIASAALGCVRGGVPIGLQSINSLRLSYNDWKYGLDAVDALPFMTLPSLTNFTTYQFEGDGGWDMFSETKAVTEGTDEQSQPSDGENDGSGGYGQDDLVNASRPTPFGRTYYLHPHSSAITQLHFDYTLTSFRLLDLIIALPRRLESLRYDVGMDAKVAFEPRWMYKGLCTQKNSLKELVITSDYGNLTSMSATRDDSVLGSLNTFSHLQHLRVPASALLFFPEDGDSPPISPPNCSPLDLLLPPSLIRLEADVEDQDGMEDFVAMTGLPNTLGATSQSLPELRIFAVVGIGHPAGFLKYPCDGRLWPDEESWSVGHKICLLAMSNSSSSVYGDPILQLVR